VPRGRAAAGLALLEDALRLDASEKPEFDIWRWVDFWYPAAHVVNFKRQVYERALRQFAPVVESLLSVQLGDLPHPTGQKPDGPGRKRPAAA